MMKMQMVSAHIVIPTNRDWNHRPNSGPTSISMSLASISTRTELISIDVLPPMIPEALDTTLCATSNTAMTIFHVFVTISTAQKVLNMLSFVVV